MSHPIAYRFTKDQRPKTKDQRPKTEYRIPKTEYRRAKSENRIARGRARIPLAGVVCPAGAIRPAALAASIHRTRAGG